MKPVALALLAFCPSLAQASSVLTVGAGQMFTDLPAAVAAAQAGDVILLRTYSAVADFAGKGLSVVEDDLFSVSFSPIAAGLPITISAIPAGDVLMISGAETVYPVHVSNCAGAVRFQNCQFLGGLSISNCVDVRLSNCQVRGRPLVSTFGSGNLALSIDGSSVVLDHTRVLASNGTNSVFVSGIPVPAGAGGDGMHVTSSTVLLSGCDVQSGKGGAGMSGTCGSSTPPTPGGDAGDALVVTDTASSVSLLETSAFALQPGVGGFGLPTGLCSQPGGASGLDVNAPPGTMSYLSGSARWITTFAIAREGQVLHLDAFGQAGDTVVLAVSDGVQTGVTIVPTGSIGIAMPPRRLVLGTIGVNGTLALDLNVPELGAGVFGRVVHVQVVCIDVLGQAWFGTPMAFTLFDASL